MIASFDIGLHALKGVMEITSERRLFACFLVLGDRESNDLNRQKG